MTTKAEVLIVDDNESVLEVIRDNLEFYGYEVTSASTAADALILARCRLFDVIVTDYAMPGMNGIELIRELRSEQQKMPAVLVTGYAHADMITPEVMPAMLLRKPVRSELLHTTISGLLGR